MLGRSPTVKTVSETQALLTAIGGGTKETKKILDQMLEIAERTEKSIAESQRLKKEADEAELKSNNTLIRLSKEKNELAEQRDKLNNDISTFRAESEKRNRELTDKEKTLSAQKAEFDQKVKAESMAMDKRKTDLDTRESKLKRREIDYSNEHQKLTEAVNQLKKIGEMFASVTRNL